MCAGGVFFVGEAGVEVCAGAEHLVVAGYDDGFYAWVEGEQGEGGFELGGHGVGEGIVFSGPVERYEYYSGWSGRRGWNVGDADVLEGKGGV